MQKARSLSQGSFNSRSISSKINLFKEKFQQSQKKFYGQSIHKSPLSKKSSINNLDIKRPLSKQVNRTTRLPSAIEQKSSQKQILNFLVDSNEFNPQKRFTLINLKQSILLQQLDSKAMEITRYSQKNSLLLNKKQALQNKISNLKKKIAEQQKRYNDSKWACANLRNQIELTQSRLGQKSTLQSQLTKKSSFTQKQVQNLSKEQFQLQSQSNYNKQHIEKLKDETNILLLQIINTNTLLLDQQAMRIRIRDKLNLKLKVMENAAITYQELLSQREHLRGEVEKSFVENRLRQLSCKREQPKASTMMLSINSNYINNR